MLLLNQSKSNQTKHSYQEISGYTSDVQKDNSVVFKSNKSQSEENNVRFSYDLYGKPKLPQLKSLTAR